VSTESGEGQYLDRGFWLYGLQPSYGYDSAAAELLADMTVHRVLPVYRWPMGSSEFEVSDLVDVQFDDGLSESEALALLASHGLRFVQASDYVHNLWECALDDTIGTSPLEYGNAMHVLPGVKWACAAQYATLVAACVNDPYYQYQYYLNGQNGGIPGIDIAAEAAWQIPLVNPSVLVAVFDDGIVPHEDLPAERIVPGWDFAYNDNDPAPGPEQNHGMACAGIIAASHNNIGIAGVCGTCRILPVRTNYRTGEKIKGDKMAAAFYFASQQGARVFSCSWTYGLGPNDALANAIRYVTNRCDSGGLGAVVVCASGNDYFNEVMFPASMPEVIAVGAVHKNGAKWDYSNYGSALDVVAPSGDGWLQGDQWTIDGMDTLGWNPHVTGAGDAGGDQNYTSRMGGTSGACPQVAGIAALMLACENIGISDCNPGPEILWAIINTATDLPPAGWDSATGFGLANAYQAMLSVSYNSPFPPCNCLNQGNVDTLTSPCVVDVFDVIQMIEIAFSGGLDITDSYCPTSRGDVDRVNSPGVVDVMDVIQIIAIAFSSGFADNPCTP
jgi:hypothetical protein